MIGDALSVTAIDTHTDLGATRERRSGPVGVLGLLVLAVLALGIAPVWMPESYSWVEYGTSESAAQGIDGAWIARSGFILFGLAVLLLVPLRRNVWQVAGSVLHTGFAVSMFAVAAFSTKPWEEGVTFVESEDLLHSLFASVMGFCFVGGVVTVMVLRRATSFRTVAPDIVALAITATVMLLLSSSVWGVLQRLIFLTAAVWYAREARLARTPIRAHHTE